MSRIFAESSVKEQARAYWKRFAASATDYVHKYRYDPFLRTEVHTIALFVCFSTFLLIVMSVSSYYLYHDVTNAMADAIKESILAEASPETIGESVVIRLEELQREKLVILATIVIAATVVAGYAVARIILTPTRNALEFQKQFIGNVAHELRTPLSNIKTESEVAMLDPLMREETKNLLTSNVQELNRISEIINNLLSLSASIRPERMEFRDEDLGTIVEHAIRKLADFAEAKGHEITVRMSERRLVWGNATALEQIAVNILKNAIMYTQPGGTIAISVEPVQPDYMELTVRDSGSGIARKDLFRVFEPYYRTEQSRNRSQGGAGLGLTIVSELVKLHRGKITMRSIEGRGTSVIVLLPAGKQSPDPSATPGQGREKMSEIAVDYSRGPRTG